MTSVRRFRLPLVLALAYVAFLAWQAPHTVHHLLESEVEAHEECALGVGAERASGTPVAVVTAIPVGSVDSALPSVPVSLVPEPAPLAVGARAPPLLPA